MKHKNFKDRAELLEAAAASIRMQEADAVEPVCKYVGHRITPITDCTFRFDTKQYEFPLAIVEGKQVWEGDELYFHTGLKDTVIGYSDDDEQLSTANNWYFSPKLCSWTTPKPKTVMVELLEEDVKELAEWHGSCLAPRHPPIYHRIYRACAEALKADGHRKAVQK